MTYCDDLIYYYHTRGGGSNILLDGRSIMRNYRSAPSDDIEIIAL